MVVTRHTHPVRLAVRRVSSARQVALGGNAMASQTPERSDRGVRYPRTTTQDRRKLRLDVPGAQEFEKGPAGRGRHAVTDVPGEVGLDSQAAAMPRMTPFAGSVEQE